VRKIVAPSFYNLLDFCENNNFSVVSSVNHYSAVKNISRQKSKPNSLYSNHLFTLVSVSLLPREELLCGSSLYIAVIHSFITCPLVEFSNNQSLTTHRMTSKIKRQPNIKNITSANVSAEQAVYCLPSHLV